MARRDVYQPKSRGERQEVHPWPVRVMHWLNALAVLVMIGSGWRIYNASPVYDFYFPGGWTLGGWLAGAIEWHLAFLWLLVLNGAFYVGYALWTRRFMRVMGPLSLRQLARDLRDVLRLKLHHDQPLYYNMPQKLAYLGVLAALVAVVASGLVVWKPVQFPLLRELMGDFDNARRVHFWAMAAIVAFIALHLVMVALVPQSLRTMLGGGRKQ